MFARLGKTASGDEQLTSVPGKHQEGVYLTGTLLRLEKNEDKEPCSKLHEALETDVSTEGFMFKKDD